MTTLLMAPFKVVHPAWLQRQVDLIQQVLGLAVLGPARKTGSKAVLNRDTKSENHVRKKQKVHVHTRSADLSVDCPSRETLRP